MKHWPRRLLRMFVDGFIENTSPDQLAGAVAIGIVLGLVPKDNLLAKLLGLLLLVLKVNLAAGMLTAMLVSFTGPLTHLLAHPVGLWLLSLPALRGFWTELYNMPLVPWTAFNNTVVLGSLVLGTLLFIPSFIYARRLMKTSLLPLAAHLSRGRFYAALRKTPPMRWYLND